MNLTKKYETASLGVTTLYIFCMHGLKYMLCRCTDTKTFCYKFWLKDMDFVHIFTCMHKFYLAIFFLHLCFAVEKKMIRNCLSKNLSLYLSSPTFIFTCKYEGKRQNSSFNFLRAFTQAGSNNKFICVFSYFNQVDSNSVCECNLISYNSYYLILQTDLILMYIL